jgi:polysaccharide pyruvyl transferase WcaK-like protein
MTSGSGGACIVLHRAITNAGDFLIRDRSLRLLARHRPDLDICSVEGWRPLADQLDPETLAAARAIVISGGPGYQRGMYPGKYPLAPLADLHAPVFLVGMGSYTLREVPAAGVFDPESDGFLRWVVARDGRLGARDDVSLRLVSGLGLPATMTGDPAWYDADWLAREDYAMRTGRIAFTPPANPLYHEQGLRLLRRLAGEYGAGEVLVVFNRGEQPTFARACAELGIATVDIADGAAGFALFDEARFHVGYRVHSHLYCLSHATPSWLIAEDTRGAGVLETLGPLGVDGRSRSDSWAARTAWRQLPRLGSARSAATRRLGLLAARLARLPDVSTATLSLIEEGAASGFAGHVRAKAVIRRTHPTMVDLLQAIP